MFLSNIVMPYEDTKTLEFTQYHKFKKNNLLFTQS